jgi:glycosyltransferase involved in cell wall biosynthesis
MRDRNNITGKSPKTTLLIPTLNEEENLPRVLSNIPPIVTEILIVDGHSKDNTVKVARELRPDVRIVYQKGKGKGDALKCGIQEASGDIVVILDADASMDPREIPRFIAALMNGYDYVKGSRFLAGGGTLDMPAYRRLADRAFVFLEKVLYGAKYTDATYGYKAFWVKAFKDIKLRTNGFETDAEIDIKAKKAGLRVTEVPCHEEKRFRGEAKLHSLRDGWRILITILGERFRS